MLQLDEAANEVRLLLAAGNLEGALALTDELLHNSNQAKRELFGSPGFHGLIVDAAAAAFIAKDRGRVQRYMRLVNLPQARAPRVNCLSRNDLEVMRVVAWYHTRPTLVPELPRSFFHKARQRVADWLDRWSAAQEEMLRTAITHARWASARQAALTPYTP